MKTRFNITIPFLILSAFFALMACKQGGESSVQEAEAEQEMASENTEKSNFRGEFLYVADAAVLKGDDFIYGVKLDSMSMVLAERVSPVKETEFDMVKVIVSGTLEPKPADQEGWDEILTITEIHYVNNKPEKADIKLETN